MKSLLSLFALASLAFYISCDKADEIIPKSELDKLPPITQEGKNTFGCLIDGNAFVVTNTSRMSAIYQGVYHRALSLSGEIDTRDVDANISVFIGNPIAAQREYQLMNDSIHRGRFNNQIKNCIYTTSQAFTGHIYIYKFDSLNYIVSGLFEFDAYSKDCKDTIRITEGRFDMQYVP